MLAPYAGQPTSAGVGRRLAEVLRSPQLSGLHQHAAPRGPSLLQQLGSFLLSLLGDLYRAAGPNLWIYLAAAVLVGLLGLGFWRLRTSRARLRAPNAATSEPVGEAAALRPDRLFAEAEALLREGRTREAVRLSFQALLLSVSARVVPLDPTWTNSELLVRATRAAGLRVALDPIVQQFDVVVYGNRDLGTEASTAFTAACRRTADRISR